MVCSAESLYGAQSGRRFLPRPRRGGKTLAWYPAMVRARKRKGWRSLLKLEYPPRRISEAGFLAATEGRCEWIPPLPRIEVSIPPFSASETDTLHAPQLNLTD